MQVDTYQPVTVFSLFTFTFLFYIVMLALGGFMLWAFTHFENRIQRFDLLEKLVLSVAISSALIPLMVFVLTPFSGFNNLTTICIMLCILALAGFIALKNKHKMKAYIIELKTIPPIIVITLAVSFGIRLLPTLGLYVYPGNDAKFHTLYAYLIIKNRGYPVTFAPFYPVAVTYNLGLHAIAVFFFYLLPFPIEQILMLLTNTYNFLFPVSMYSLGSKLFDDKRIAANMCFLSGVVVHVPMVFFNWGGNSYIFGFFLIPVFISVAIQMIKENKFSMVLSILLVILTVGLLYAHYLPFFIAICGLVSVNFLQFLRKNVKSFMNALLSVFFGLLISLPRILLSISATEGRESFLIETMYKWWAKTQIFDYSYFTSFSGLEKVFVRLIIKDFGGSIPLIAFIGLLFYLSRFNRTNSKSNSIVSIFVWSAILFLITANGPIGLYFLEFPYWYIFDPTYIRPGLTLPLVSMAGYGFTNLSGWAGSLGDLKYFKKLTAKQVFQKVFFVFILVSITIESLLLFNYMVGNYEDSAVTTADYKAIIWIQNNTDENATFFVTSADAGEWIVAIAHRRTYSMAKSNGDNLVSEEYVTKVNQMKQEVCENPNSEEAFSLLKHFGIDYIYIGKKAIYDSQRLDPNLFLGSRNYEPVYSDGDIWIFKIIYN